MHAKNRRVFARTLRQVLQAFGVVLTLSQSATAAPGIALQTTVEPRPDEDLAEGCGYEITILDPSRTIKGVFVIFDRGRDMHRYYGDPDVQEFAQRHDLALMLPFHCRAKSGTDGDIPVDPFKGLGRALFSALSQLAESSKHPELASAKVILLGFSGTGSLSARFAEYAPDRVVAIIASNPGHGTNLGMDTIELSAKAVAIPQLILVGSADRITGTERPYAYFRKHFDQGAPWTFIVQNGIPHCCIINAKPLVLEWLHAVVVRRQTRASGSYGFIRTTPSEIQECPKPSPDPANTIWCRGTTDTWGGANWSVAAAQVERRTTGPEGMIPAGWLPNGRFARQWISFVRRLQHPITSLP
jgi:hypothetical protein